MFKIKKVRPLFTGVVTTAQVYTDEIKTAGGLLVDTTKLAGTINPYQQVIAVGSMCKDVKEGDVVKLNFSRYLQVKHVPGVIKDNVQSDNMTAQYSIPKIEMDGKDFLFVQSNDIEYIVTDYDVDEGGLFQ